MFYSPLPVHTVKTNYKILDCWSRDMLRDIFFLRKKSGHSFSTHHIVYLPRKMFPLTDQIPFSDCLYFSKYSMCIIVYFPSCEVINFEMNLIFLIKLFLYIPKIQNKNLNTEEWKELLRWNKKHFSSFLKGFQLPKLASAVRVSL